LAHPRDILKSLNASPLKSLSQNFLTSPHWAEKLVTDFLRRDLFDEVWEVGPGLGALTEILLQKTQKPIKLFELDRKLSSYLVTKFPDTPLFQGDFLEQDWTSLKKPNQKIAVLSNLPYHLSSAMIFKMVDHKPCVSHFLFTFQKEFAERLTAKPETKAYGALTLLTELHFQVSLLGTLPPGAFYPPPSVSSQAILFVPREAVPQEANLVKVIKGAFAHRRKKLANNLKELFPEVSWEQALSEMGLSPQSRAESLNLAQFQELSSKIKT